MIDNRKYGIDVARLLSMFFVVLLHNLGRGGVLDWALSSPRSLAYVTLENVAIVAVNVFALISGYLCSGRSLKPRRLFDLWSSAFFWSVLLAIVGILKGSAPGVWTARAFFPLLGNVYWYLSAFIVLQLITPILSAGIDRLGREKTLVLSMSIVAACSVIGFTEWRGIGDGCTAFWLMVLWLVGRSLCDYREEILNLITTSRLIVASTLLPLCVTWFELRDATAGYDPSRWLSYISPTAVIQSICLFELLLRVKIGSTRIKKVLVAMSSAAFGVYLIDSSGWFYGFWLNDRFAWVNTLPTRIGVPLILCLSALMFLAFLLAEWLRRLMVAQILDVRKSR